MTLLRLVLTAAAALAAASLVAAPATQVAVKGVPLTLAGPPPAVGDPAPDFSALDAGFEPVGLDSFAGRPVLISVVPSLDTPVCSRQTKRFAAELAGLPDDVAVVTVSMDLPFAQKEFCGREGIEEMVVLSDAARREFGERWGVLIPERGLLARSLFVVDREGVVRHVQVVPELTDEPDYDAALAALRRVAR